MLAGNSFFPRLIRGIVVERHRPISAPSLKPRPLDWSDNAVTTSWLGHASVLINFYGVHVLTDPALYTKVGADLGFTTVGRKRLVEPALDTTELPKIDLILLSHAHMDHLDMPTLYALPKSSVVVTAKGTSDLVNRAGFLRVKELRWGEKATIATPTGRVEVQAFQVRHWGARWGSDRYRGYNGYVLEREGRKLIFGGDTAMCNHFRILRGGGPYDLAIMPIGAYKKGNLHCTPEEALRMSNEAGANFVMPIHHSTFELGPEPRGEPIRRFSQAIEKERLALREIGGTFSLP